MHPHPLLNVHLFFKFQMLIRLSCLLFHEGSCIINSPLPTSHFQPLPQITVFISILTHFTCLRGKRSFFFCLRLTCVLDPFMFYILWELFSLVNHPFCPVDSILLFSALALLQPMDAFRDLRLKKVPNHLSPLLYFVICLFLSKLVERLSIAVSSSHCAPVPLWLSPYDFTENALTNATSDCFFFSPSSFFTFKFQSYRRLYNRQSHKIL